MKTRLGKIAQLPKSIRTQLNRRLENGQQSPELLKWLNSLPQIKKLIAKKFDNQPITKSNLSHWRHGGYQDWQADQARQAHIQRISESGASLEQAETGDLFENFARIAVAELMGDLDSLQKLRGEKRSQHLHHLVRDLARLQNSFNRSRWAELAWTKYNNRFLGPEDYEAEEEKAPDKLPARTPISDLPTPIGTPSPSTPVAPDCTQSQAGNSRDSQPKEPYNPFKYIYHTRCECGEPCPKCHAPDSDYPLDEVLLDKQFYNKHGRNPHDRHGNHRHLVNFDCDCFCDRCAQKASSTPCADPDPGRVALPRHPIILHAESREETSEINTNPQPPANPLNPPTPIGLDPRSDFLRQMALLRNAPR